MSRLPAITLDQLAVLDAIAAEGSFAAAARALHRVPSAVSYTIKGLEAQLDVALFNREGHRAELTPEGLRLLEHARAVLREARELEEVAGRLTQGWESELHVVVDGVLPMGPITQVLRAFADDAVPTRLRIDVESRYGVPDRFEADAADIMLLLEFDDDSGTLDWRPLPDLPMVLLAAPGHALARGTPIDRATLQTFPELVVRDSSPRFAERDPEAFLGNRNLVYLSDFHTKRLGLLAGAGFGWMPQHLVAGDLAAGTLVPVLLDEGHTWTYHPRLVTRHGRPLGRAGQRFVDALTAEVRQTS